MEEFKKQYQKMRNPDIDDELIFEPPKPYMFFGEQIQLINEREAASIVGIDVQAIQQKGYDGDITRIKVEKMGHNKYYFLEHECIKLANEKAKRKSKIKSKKVK
jgi:hypothetical protein